MSDETARVGELEVIGGELAFGAPEHLAVGDPGTVVVEVEDALDPLDIHCQPLEPVGQLGRDRVAFDPADLLEIGELADLHAVEPDLPAESPGAQGRALPVILDKADVVQAEIDANRRQAREIKVLTVRRRRLQDYLELVILLQSVGVLAVAAVGRAARRLDIGRPPRFGSQRAQSSRRMESAGADLDVVRLQDYAALLRPEVLQVENQRLETQDRPMTRCWITAAAGNRVCRSRVPRRQHRRRRPRTARDLRHGAQDAGTTGAAAAARAPARSASDSRSTPRRSPE